MQEHELWITALFNRFLAGPAVAVLNALSIPVADPARPWANFLTMQILVVLLMVIVFSLLRSRLSMDKPGKLQHIMETAYLFLKGQAEDSVGHGAKKYLPYFATVFFFILFSNLIGIIPTFESPTMFPYVPAGCALATFLYYNWAGLREHGLGKYLAHFAGPLPLLAPLMIPIEIISHLARPLSLTIRLYANMFAGEQVTLIFLGLTYFLVPAVFMGLHTFVGILQAYIFALLTMIYVGGAVAHDEEH